MASRKGYEMPLLAPGFIQVVSSQVAVISSIFCPQAFAQNAGLDSSFHPDIVGLVSTVAVQPDGKVLVGGNFSSVNALPKL